MVDDALEFLLAFDGRTHFLEKNYFFKFSIRRVEATVERPHGLKYSFTLHEPGGRRIFGMDNAHLPPPKGSRFKKRRPVYDHRHASEADTGSAYKYVDAETLLEDFFNGAEAVLAERGIRTVVLEEHGGEK
jgi:hypothetical protein